MRVCHTSAAAGCVAAARGACGDGLLRGWAFTDGGIRVSLVSLDQPAGVVERARSVLSEAELERALSGTPEVRRRRLLSRAALRMALAEQLGMRPEALALTAGAHGKPALARRARPPLHFNVSVSGDICLIALTTVGPVGADIEHASAHLEPAARSFLAPAERRAVERLPGAARGDALLTLWTCKEALLKGLGRGLQEDPSRVVLSGPPALGVVSLPGDRAAAWRLIRFRPGPSAAAAVAVRAGGRSRSPALELSVMPWR